GEEGLVGRATFEAARGEHNRLTVSYASGWIVFSDSANPVHARGDCRQRGVRGARCLFTGAALANLGDGDDTLRKHTPPGGAVPAGTISSRGGQVTIGGTGVAAPTS